jgi:hypothetical protein
MRPRGLQILFPLLVLVIVVVLGQAVFGPAKSRWRAVLCVLLLLLRLLLWFMVCACTHTRRAPPRECVAAQADALVTRGLNLQADCKKCIADQRHDCKTGSNNWQNCPPPQPPGQQQNNYGAPWCGNSSWCDTSALITQINLNGGCGKNQNAVGYILNEWQASGRGLHL